MAGSTGPYLWPPTAGTKFSFPEERNVDRIRQRSVSGVGGMDMVTAVVLRKHPGLRRGIAQDPIEVDYRVVSTAGADPLVDGLTLQFVRWSVESEWSAGNDEALKRRQSRAID